ncbi:DUF2141 domain-containing protein [Daeguia caeni]|uniref:DUF2141 domain-containing protein n=1 Tax=Daeguia caeni TaxID=439612 RepID=A0ABV9H3A0_9HYPH
MRNSRTKLAVISISTVLFSSAAMAASLDLNITNLRNDKGVVRCGLFNSRQSFGKPGQQVATDNATIQGGGAKCHFDNVAPGTYAVAVFHAENNENTLSYGLFGKPKEGVGFSNNPSITFGAPSFDDAAFQMGTQNKSMQIRIQY